MSSNPKLWFTPLHYAEWTHAIAQQVFYNKISEAEGERIYRHMKADRAAGLWVETPVAETVTKSARIWRGDMVLASVSAPSIVFMLLAPSN